MTPDDRRRLARVRFLALRAEIHAGGSPSVARFARVVEPLFDRPIAGSVTPPSIRRSALPADRSAASKPALL